MNPFKGHPTTQQIDVPLKDVKKRLPLRVLSTADWTHWTTFGYVVVPAAVPEANIRRLVDLLWEFCEMTPTDSRTWSRRQLRDHEMQELNNSGMVEISTTITCGTTGRSRALMMRSSISGTARTSGWPSTARI